MSGSWGFFACLFLFFLIYFSKKIKKHHWLSKILDKIKVQFVDKELLQENWESPWEVVKNRGRQMLLPLFWQIMGIMADSLTISFLFLGFNYQPYFYCVVIGLILTKAISMLTITPGALILFEGAMTLFYTSFGVPLQLALMVTVLFRALSFWLPMPFGLFLYRHLDRKTNNPVST